MIEQSSNNPIVSTSRAIINLKNQPILFQYFSEKSPCDELNFQRHCYAALDLFADNIFQKRMNIQDSSIQFYIVTVEHKIKIMVIVKQKSNVYEKYNDRVILNLFATYSIPNRIRENKISLSFLGQLKYFIETLKLKRLIFYYNLRFFMLLCIHMINMVALIFIVIYVMHQCKGMRMQVVSVDERNKFLFFIFKGQYLYYLFFFITNSPHCFIAPYQQSQQIDTQLEIYIHCYLVTKPQFCVLSIFFLFFLRDGNVSKNFVNPVYYQQQYFFELHCYKRNKSVRGFKQKKPQTFMDKINLVQPFIKLIQDFPKINQLSYFKNIISANLDLTKSNFLANYLLIQFTNQQKITFSKKILIQFVNFLHQNLVCVILIRILFMEILNICFVKSTSRYWKINEWAQNRQTNRNQIVINVID